MYMNERTNNRAIVSHHRIFWPSSEYFITNQVQEPSVEGDAKAAEDIAVARPVAPEIKPSEGAIPPPPPPPAKPKVSDYIFRYIMVYIVRVYK